MGLFFEEPRREFNVREAARILKIAPATASKELKKLAKKEILLEKKERNLILYKANLESEHYRDTKIFYNIRKIKESGLIEHLNSFYLKPTIVLFGSASLGMDVENSDIDMLVISERTNIIKLEEFERKINRRIQLFVCKAVKDLKNQHLINSVLNGITIQGELVW